MNASPTPVRVRLLDSVRPRLGAERGFLFDERSGRVYGLNASAAFVTARLQERHRTLADLVAASVEEFEVDETTARRDVEAFVEHLLQEQLAEAVDG